MAKKDADEYFMDASDETTRKFMALHKALVKKWTKKLGKQDAKQAVYEGIRECEEHW